MEAIQKTHKIVRELNEIKYNVEVDFHISYSSDYKLLQVCKEEGVGPEAL